MTQLLATGVIRAGILTEAQVPELIVRGCGSRNSERIDSIISDLIENSDADGLKMSPAMQEVFNFFHSFMYSDVYTNPIAKGEEGKVQGILFALYEYYVANPDKLPAELCFIAEKDGRGRAACDYISGMTDSYAVTAHRRLFDRTPDLR